VADAARAVLDGHIVLSRGLAESGVYPAVDIETSISRLTRSITSAPHQQLIRKFREINATYARNRDLITIGAYVKGTDPRVDEAVRYWPDLQAFLQQGADLRVSLPESIDALAALFHSTAPNEVAA
jgi:flagellum-specific ATP synthase